MAQFVSATNIEHDANIKNHPKNKRGVSVFTTSQLMSLSGLTRDGERVSAKYEQSYFALDPEERESISQLTSPIFGVVSGRKNRMAALKWSVSPKLKEEDRHVKILKERNSIYKEFSTADVLSYRIAAGKQLMILRRELPDLLPDASNFNKALVRWRRRNRTSKQFVSDEIEDWLLSPNDSDDWEDYVKKWVHDQLVHGASAQYKSYTNRLDKLYILPGGSVFPLKGERVGTDGLYAQFMNGRNPLIYKQDEIIFTNYQPFSNRAHGQIPVEALINKITEILLYDEYMAKYSDGTKPPEKAIVFGQDSPFGMSGESDYDMPMDEDEQKRVETKVNEARKEAIVTLTGYGKPVILDLSKENTMGVRNERTRMIREEIALVFNATNLEMNMSDSAGVSGRSTANSLMTLDQNKAIIPLANSFSTDLNKHAIPFRYGEGWDFSFEVGIDEMEDVKMLQSKLSSGAYSVNELRIEKGEEPFEGEEFDKPRGAVAPNGSEASPLFMSSLNA